MMILPILILLAIAFIMLIGAALNGPKKILTIIGGIGIVISLLSLGQLNRNGMEMFGGRLQLDSVSWWFQCAFLSSGLFLLLVSYISFDQKNNDNNKNTIFNGLEFLSLAYFALGGAMIMVLATDLVTLYVSLELTTIPMALLVAWLKSKEESSEAGLKYILLGGFSSAFLLYSFTMMYGISGSTDLATIAQNIHNHSAVWYLAALSLVTIGFKMSLVPFHLWAADVYQGSPTSITAFLSTASKGVGLALMFQLFYKIFGFHLKEWGLIISVVAAITMTLGNVVALNQSQIKRFMAFSSISQAGYFMMGFLGAEPKGVSAMLFYFLVYIFCNFTAFAIITIVTNQKQDESLDSFKGLSLSNPILAFLMLLALLSLAGVPPLAGFVGKFFLFSIAAGAGFNWLVGVAAINSTISLFYYLNVVKKMYMEDSETEQSLEIGVGIKIALALGSIGIITFGIIPSLYESIYANTNGWLSPLTAMVSQIF